MKTQRPILCPSAQPEMEASSIFGVVGGTSDMPETAYLSVSQPVTEDLLKLAEPVAPAEVFRFSAPCQNSACPHFTKEDSKCRLATKIVEWSPVVMDALPACAIRSDCRWWQQEGKEACLRCPQVVTIDYNPDDDFRRSRQEWLDELRQSGAI